jgi:hypothetical protein
MYIPKHKRKKIVFIFTDILLVKHFCLQFKQKWMTWTSYVATWYEVLTPLLLVNLATLKEVFESYVCYLPESAFITSSHHS